VKKTSSSIKNESGVILVTVVVLTIILLIVAIGIMSLNVSQVKTAASVIDTIKAEQLATGIFYQDYQSRVDGQGPSSLPTNIVIGYKTYTITRTTDITTGTPNNTNQVQFNITY
jgi:hypothetical protein